MTRRLSLALLALGATAVYPHSFWPGSYSARSAVAVRDGELQAIVVIEIPTFSLVPKFRQHFAHLDLMKEVKQGRFEALEDEFRAFQFERLAEGLAFEIDGERPAGAWVPLDTPGNGYATEGFFVYELGFRPERPLPLAGRHEIRIRNLLFPYESLVFANTVELACCFELLESSAPQPPPGTDLSTGSPAELDLWSSDPALRDFRVVLLRLPS